MTTNYRLHSWGATSLGVIAYLSMLACITFISFVMFMPEVFGQVALHGNAEDYKNNPEYQAAQNQSGMVNRTNKKPDEIRICPRPNTGDPKRDVELQIACLKGVK